MQKITCTKPFRYSIDGLTVRDFSPGPLEVPDNVAKFALKRGFAEKVFAEKKGKKAKK